MAEQGTAGLLDALSGRAAFEASPLPTFLLDASCSLVGANRRGRDLFPGVELPGRLLADLLVRPGADLVGAHAATALGSGEPVGFDVVCPVEGAEVRARLWLSSLARPDCRVALVGVIETGGNADAARDELIACAGHELRNALFTLGSYGELLESKAGSLTVSDLESLGAGLIQAAGRFDLLLRDLVSLCRSEEPAGDQESVAVDLAAVVDDAVTSSGVGPVLTAVPGGLAVRAVPGRLEQVLTNLLVNAGRHGAGAITVSARSDGRAVTLTVADEGPGVPAWAVERLFEPFFRVNRGQEGSGLGLSIVRRLVESFGGAIRYEPNRPAGARFVVRLPAA